jgi:hypothetical protein
MIGILICGYNIFCHLDNINSALYNSEYPNDVKQLCSYFKEQKVELPEYCFYKSKPEPPRRRSEF